MNPTSKKFISLFLVFSLLALSGNLYAKKRGAEIEIQKKDGQLISGELIAVKKDSLLLLESGIDVAVDIKDIVVITIVKNSKALLGAIIGGSIGAAAGALLFLASEEEKGGFWRFWAFSTSTMQGAAIGTIFGGTMGVAAGTDKTIQVEGRSDLEISNVLEKLRKKARIPDYK